MTTEAAQWREVVQGKVFALYVHNRHRVALAQNLEDGSWLVTMPDAPEAKHPAKDKDDAFRIGRKISLSWFKSALEQLGKDTQTKVMSNAEATEVTRQRTRVLHYGKTKKGN